MEQKEVRNMDIILMIHGFMENSTQFESLAQALSRSGRLCQRIVLPGHEADLRAFCRSNRAQWRSHVRKALAKACARYDRILLVGHSMGGLLALDAARGLPVQGVVAVALPLRARITGRAIRYRLAMLGQARPTDSRKIAAVRACCGVHGIKFWNVLGLIPNTLGLLKEMTACRRGLAAVTTPLTVIHSENDDIVSPRSAALVEQRLPAARVIRLQEASHFHYSPADIALIAQAIEAYLTR